MWLFSLFNNKLENARKQEAGNRYDEEAGRSKSRGEANEAWVRYADAVGVDTFSEENQKSIKQFRKELEERDASPEGRRKYEERYKDGRVDSKGQISALDAYKKDRAAGMSDRDAHMKYADTVGDGWLTDGERDKSNKYRKEIEAEKNKKSETPHSPTPPPPSPEPEPKTPSEADKSSDDVGGASVGEPSDGTISDDDGDDDPPKSGKRRKKTDEEVAESRKKRLESQHAHERRHQERMIQQRFGVQPNWTNVSPMARGQPVIPGSVASSGFGPGARAVTTTNDAITDFMSRSTETHEATATIATEVAERVRIAREKILEASR